MLVAGGPVTPVRGLHMGTPVGAGDGWVLLPRCC